MNYCYLPAYLIYIYIHIYNLPYSSLNQLHIPIWSYLSSCHCDLHIRGDLHLEIISAPQLPSQLRNILIVHLLIKCLNFKLCLVGFARARGLYFIPKNRTRTQPKKNVNVFSARTPTEKVIQVQYNTHANTYASTNANTNAIHTYTYTYIYIYIHTFTYAYKWIIKFIIRRYGFWTLRIRENLWKAWGIRCELEKTYIKSLILGWFTWNQGRLSMVNHLGCRGISEEPGESVVLFCTFVPCSVHAAWCRLQGIKPQTEHEMEGITTVKGISQPEQLSHLPRLATMTWIFHCHVWYCGRQHDLTNQRFGTKKNSVVIHGA